VALLRAQARSSRLKWSGATIGDLTVIGEAEISGPARNLVIADEVTLGCCEISLHARVEIGRRAVVNDGAVLLTGSHALRSSDWRLCTAPITIGEYAWIAQNAIILPGVSIGRGAVVGAGTVVRENVPDYALAIGNPASIIVGKRQPVLAYSPVRGIAAYEAWLGPVKEQNGAHAGLTCNAVDACDASHQ